MPFDDSDIKKMIEAQTTKGGLRFGTDGSTDVQDLIGCMLQPEVTQRWPIELVRRHPWLDTQINIDQHTLSMSYVNAIKTSDQSHDHNGNRQIQKR